VPRTGWAAIGAVIGALVAVSIVDIRLQIAATAAFIGLLIAARLVRAKARVMVAATAAGAVVVLVRAIAGGLIAPPTLPAPSPTEIGDHHAGTVVSVGVPDGGLQRAVVELRPPEPAVTVYAWLPRYPPVVPEDVISFDGRLEAPPADGDFADYLARNGVDFTDKAHTMDRIGADGSPLAALEGIRRAANDLINRVLPEPQAGLATAMAIGLRDVVSRDVSDDFRISGLSHVVAISGWHIAMLGAVVAALLGGLPRRPRSVLIVLAIVAYAIIAGAAPSILRAALMASAVIVARESGRRGQAKAALALTCLALVVLDPATVSDVGFELSAVATAGLLAWATPLHGWLAARVPRHTPGWLVEALGVSLTAQAATLPLILLQFGRLSLVAPLANLLIAPLVAPAMLVTAVCIAAGATLAAGLPTVAMAPVSLVGALLVGAMIAIAHLCATLPFASIDLPPPFNLLGAAASAVALVWIVRRRRQPKHNADPAPPRAAAGVSLIRKSRLVALAAACVLSLLLAVVALARPDGRLHVTVLDVGQGDSILLEGPRGGRMLIDTGPDPDRELALLDARLPAWDRRVDMIVLTHPHEDHVGGLALLLQRYRIGSVVETGMVGRGPGDAAYRRVLAEQDRHTTLAAAGDRLWLDGIELDVDWPPPGTVPARASTDGKQVNNESLVIDLRYGERRMLFTGDAEEEVDPQLLARGLAEHLGGPIDVLKVAHHGSGTATTNALLDVLQPRIALISVGADNTYGHPAPATVDRLREHGATVYRTDLDGSIEVSTDGTDLLVSTDHHRAPTPAPSTNIGLVDRVVRQRKSQTYNRLRVHPLPDRGRRDPARSSAQRQAAASFDCRCRNCSLPRCCHGPPRRARGRHPHRDSRAAARPGQDAAGNQLAQAPGSCRRRREVVERARIRGAWAGGGQSSRHAPGSCADI
jgi:competence protein ComEC